ncbi:MAG TPA: SDR family oxidoreductase [Solirubrobacteraceae bacterium]|jgi:3-oxoacyl-[acyl-carrier protein] reductase
MDLGLRGCAAIVGGASSGMGRAVARRLAEEGCDVTLLARRRELLDEAVAEISKLTDGGRARAVAGDSTAPADLTRTVEETMQEFGRIDIVVNNTGGPTAGDFGDLDDEDWGRAVELTLLSAIRLTRLALPALRQSGRGRVVNLTSMAVKEINDGLLLSNALRPAVTGWAKHLSREEGPHGITVNSIAPGYIDTDRLRYLYSTGSTPDEDRRRDEQSIPLRRFGAPEEIASAAAFLCSTEAAYITGVTLLVDGGLTRGLLS